MSNLEFKKLSTSKRELLGLRQIVREPLKVSTCEYTSSDTLCVKDLKLSFGKKTVQENISFSLNKGDILAILGNNGVGKSSLIKCLCGLIKQKSGSISLNGKELSAKQRQRLTFLIMQDVNHQLFSNSVIGETMLGNSATESDAKDILHKLGLSGFENRHPMALSGGQAQRLAIADSYLCNRDILVFDEPTSGLDYDDMLRVSNLIKSLSKDGKIILIVTHDEELVSKTCNKSLVLTKL
jgi:energy-coupling factor transport system ATP-binding protein